MKNYLFPHNSPIFHKFFWKFFQILSVFCFLKNFCKFFIRFIFIILRIFAKTSFAGVPELGLSKNVLQLFHHTLFYPLFVIFFKVDFCMFSFIFFGKFFHNFIFLKNFLKFYNLFIPIKYSKFLFFKIFWNSSRLLENIFWNFFYFYTNFYKMVFWKFL